VGVINGQKIFLTSLKVILKLTLCCDEEVCGRKKAGKVFFTLSCIVYCKGIKQRLFFSLITRLYRVFGVFSSRPQITQGKYTFAKKGKFNHSNKNMLIDTGKIVVLFSLLI